MRCISDPTDQDIINEKREAEFDEVYEQIEIGETSMRDDDYSITFTELMGERYGINKKDDKALDDALNEVAMAAIYSPSELPNAAKELAKIADHLLGLYAIGKTYEILEKTEKLN